MVDEPKAAGGSGGGKGMFSIDMLERMMKDPNMQKMIYPYLPEGMRTPETFEWMMKNPAYRQQLENMLSQGGAGMDSRMADMLKDFDINSPEVQQQFDAMGMKPEDMISKIMSNPELTMAFQSPKVQAAIMDCSQNPMNITKYQARASSSFLSSQRREVTGNRCVLPCALCACRGGSAFRATSVCARCPHPR